MAPSLSPLPSTTRKSIESDGTTMVADTSLQSQRSGEPRSTKRRKIALACTYCRARKTRCDGRQPACSTCVNKGAADTCVYEQGALKTQRYVSSLEARVQEFEQREMMQNSRSSHGSAETDSRRRSIQDTVRNGQTSIFDVYPSTEPCTISRSEKDYISTTGAPPTPDPDSITTDAMVIVPSPGEDDNSLVTEPSSIAFIRSMLRTAGRNRDSASHIRLQNESRRKAYPAIDFQGEGDIDLASLPPRRVADGFVNLYWEHLHPILPILHKPTFMSSYNSLWASEDELGPVNPSHRREELVFLAILNIVFAISCQFGSQIEMPRRSAVAKNFYQRSRKKFRDEFLDSPDLSVVQLLLLTGVYLQSTRHANRCWNTIGSAIRTAQSINLHLARTSEFKTQIQRESERRVWHVCVFLDRQIALIFGRPTMIHAQSKVPLPLPINDEYLLEDGEGCQPNHIYPQMGAFIYSSKLFDILNETLNTFYFNNNTIFQRLGTSSWSYRDLETVLRLNNSLDEFQESLPPYLSIDPKSGDPKYQVDGKIALGAKILYSRFLYIRIFLLRPILLIVAQPSSDSLSGEARDNDDKLEHQIALKACSLCISTVQTLIAHIHKNMDTSYWTSISHKIHYAFSCAIVLVAARLCPGIDSSTERFQTAWSQCIGIFDNYKLHFSSASHVIRILEILEDRLASSGSQAYVAATRTSDVAGSLNESTELNWDSEWAMLDNLLQYEPLGSNIVADMWSEDATVGFSWQDSL